MTRSKAEGKCDVCGSELTGLWWSAVPGRGNMCASCHENWSQAQALGPIVPTREEIKKPTLWESFLAWCRHTLRKN